MKQQFIITSLLIIICISSKATNYYFSNAGNDVNTGISASAPFKTITKLNTLTLVAGDSVLFKCGDIFRGQITINYSGNSSSGIVFTSYGSGNQPIISGAEIVTGWTLNASRYEKILTQKIYNFFVNDKEQTLARYPNEHQYLTLDSAQKTYLKDASLSSLPANYITNSRICVHTAQWCWEKSSVAAYNNAEKINYTTTMNLTGLANFGYFLYDNINLLDTANEWKFDSTSMLLSYIPETGQNPNALNCEVAAYTNGIHLIGNASYIIINNIHFEKQMNAGIVMNSLNNKHIQISNCYFARQYNYGVYDKGRYNEVNNSYFREVDGIGIFVTGAGAGKHTSHHNTFRNIGPYRNSGIGTEINLTAINFAFTDSCTAHHNNIDSTGYCGISADGTYHIVEKNIINHAMLFNNDGAALKSFGAASHHNIFRNNFISNSDGNTEGTFKANFITPAIYFDFNVSNSIVQENTIYNHTKKGIFQNSGNYNNSILGNVIYGSNYALDLNGTVAQITPITGMVVKKNSFFVLDTGAYCLRQIDFSNNFAYGTFDSNYYYQPYSNNKYILRYTGNTGAAYSFSNWQTAGNDLHTIINNFSWTMGIDSSQLFINPTDNSVAQNLSGYSWKDLDGNIVTSLTLQPWTSKILIKTNIVLPLQLVSFTATVLHPSLLGEGMGVRLKWQTENEINTSYFNIQRSQSTMSSTNNKDFITIGQINANGNNEYSFTDDSPPVEGLGLPAGQAGVVLYYRLQIIDKDGTKTYSPIRLINIQHASSNIIIYPNPAKGTVYINGNNIKQVIIYDGMGRNMLNISMAATNQTGINISNLSKGLYWIKVLDDNNGSPQQLMVQ